MEHDDANLDGNAQSPRGLDLAMDARLASLLRRRSRFAWQLTAVMLAIYFGYILLIAFRRDILAQPIGDGVTSLGIPVGIGVILAGIILTAIYVHRANRVFDPELERLRQELDE
jgi:uncharacterized membrane protein (DUF485 family)